MAKKIKVTPEIVGLLKDIVKAKLALWDAARLAEEKLSTVLQTEVELDTGPEALDWFVGGFDQPEDVSMYEDVAALLDAFKLDDRMCP